MQNIDTLENTLIWFQQARPVTSALTFNVQLGVHVEEFGEMLEELTAHTTEAAELVQETFECVKRLADHLKTKGVTVMVTKASRINFLDSLCDQLVTATGVAQTQDMNCIGALNEVNRSNFSKFVDGKPVFDANGKIAKGPHYSRADLSPFV